MGACILRHNKDPHTQQERSWKRLFFDSVVVTAFGGFGLVVSAFALACKGVCWFVLFPFRLLGLVK